MSYLPRFGLSPLLAMAVVLCATGCPLHQDQVAASTDQVSREQHKGRVLGDGLRGHFAENGRVNS